MGMLNRGAIVLKPRQPFVDWLRALPDPVLDVTLAELHKDCNAYLLPEWETPQQLQHRLREHFDEMFAQELWAWHRDARVFPKLTWTAFREWFEV